jgi:hypothetical protein
LLEEQYDEALLLFLTGTSIEGAIKAPLGVGVI